MLFYLVLAVIAAALIRHHWQLLKYAWQYICMQVSVRLFHYRKQTVADLFASRVRQTPHAPALIFEGQMYTFAALDRLSNRVAHWGLAQGLKPRHVIALLMENRLEFIVVWLGMAKIGVTSALINTNLRGASLSHSLRACETSLVIMGDECREAFEGVRGEFGPHLRVWIMDQTSSHSPTGMSTTVNVDMNGDSGGAFEFTSISTPSSPSSPSLLSASSIGSSSGGSSAKYENLSAALSAVRDVTSDFAALRTAANMNSSDLLFYIYTSGTTGMPKAAMIKHLRFALTAASFVNFFGLTQADRIYCALPMYHSAGGMIGVSCSWYIGCSLILRRKFSARNFFQDCSEQQATIVQYIGQLARYLLATPPNAFDTAHNVRMAIGNGLSEDTWDAFKARFHIRTIGEFYASTEGNANLVNNLNIKGVIGWIPPIAKLIYPIRIVRFDTREEKPLRNEEGFCMECEPNEVGELLSKIDARDPLRHFDGYTSARATSDKILSHVFSHGDRWFRSGDLVKADASGLIRFVDRVGDTFRWKGENVATTEVGAIMSVFVPSRGTTIREVNVYGVFVAGNEGRAGMASISLETAAATASSSADFSESEFDFQGFYSYLQSQLPSYQNPLFLRFQKEMEITSTFKHRKADLVTEGFDPRTIRDPLFFRDDAQKKYVRLDANIYEAIQKGKVRL